MMRCNDALYAELNLAEASDEALIAAMAAHPALIERPIAVVGNRAAVGRPLENIEALLP
jgi:arsenate reductase